MSTVMQPSITSVGGSHHVRFRDALIDVYAERLHENSHHETFAELRIESHAPDASGHVYQARLNLLSEMGKSRLAKTLKDKHRRIQEDEWVQIIEFSSVKILEAHRQGEPIIHLADKSVPENLEFRLMPFLQERQATVIFGDGDTGKSWLATLFGYLVVTGVPKLGLEPEPGKVLYLDYETDEDTLWERLLMMSDGFGEPIPDGFYYRRMHMLIAADFETLRNEVIKKRIDLIIVDSASPATGEPESAAHTTAYFNALRGLNATSLTVAHVTKNHNATAPFGSIFWRNLPRANYIVRSEAEARATERTIGIRHTKANNGPRQRDKAFTLAFDNVARSVEITKADPADIESLESTLSYGEQIAKALSRGSLTVQQIVEQTRLTDRQVRNTLSNQRNRKKFMAVERGAYGLRDRSAV